MVGGFFEALFGLDLGVEEQGYGVIELFFLVGKRFDCVEGSAHGVFQAVDSGIRVWHLAPGPLTLIVPKGLQNA
jgi:hypothetical protein